MKMIVSSHGVYFKGMMFIGAVIFWSHHLLCCFLPQFPGTILSMNSTGYHVQNIYHKLTPNYTATPDQRVWMWYQKSCYQNMHGKSSTCHQGNEEEFTLFGDIQPQRSLKRYYTYWVVLTWSLDLSRHRTYRVTGSSLRAGLRAGRWLVAWAVTTWITSFTFHIPFLICHAVGISCICKATDTGDTIKKNLIIFLVLELDNLSTIKWSHSHSRYDGIR